MDWGALLLAFFVSATALSHYREAEQAQRTARRAREGRRARCAAGAGERRVVRHRGGGDQGTVGTRVRHRWTRCPRGRGCGRRSAAARSRRRARTRGARRSARSSQCAAAADHDARDVPAGTSGGVTARGPRRRWRARASWALSRGRCAGRPMLAMAAAAGGISGALADSLVGATLQGRRQCPQCGVATEQLGARLRHGNGSGGRSRVAGQRSGESAQHRLRRAGGGRDRFRVRLSAA